VVERLVGDALVLIAGSLSDGVTWQRVAGRVCLRANHSGEVARAGSEWGRRPRVAATSRWPRPPAVPRSGLWHSDPGQDGL